ncbi:MAG: hypothetical protein H6628_03930 [Calditrichae bacterium]|nr:hypothetical protein [Calditrichia bacterium]
MAELAFSASAAGPLRKMIFLPLIRSAETTANGMGDSSKCFFGVSLFSEASAIPPAASPAGYRVEDKPFNVNELAQPLEDRFPVGMVRQRAFQMLGDGALISFSTSINWVSL